MKISVSQRHAMVVCGFLIAMLGVLPVAAYATSIMTTDITPIPDVAGSGNGTLDLRMFTFSGSEIQNTAGAFNGDNGNKTLPHSGGSDTLSFAESYVTTAGDLKAFYNLNFAPGSIHNIVLFLDLNETGGGQPNNTLAKLDVVLNPTSIQGAPNPLVDVSSAAQAAINQVFTGGSLIAWLNPEPAANLPVQSQGAGWADYAIATGIDPFGLSDSDVLLFNLSMNTLNNGSEEIFLSGTYGYGDLTNEPPPPPVTGFIPEPATLSLLASGLAGILLARKKRKSA